MAASSSTTSTSPRSSGMHHLRSASVACHLRLDRVQRGLDVVELLLHRAAGTPGTARRATGCAGTGVTSAAGAEQQHGHRDERDYPCPPHFDSQCCALKSVAHLLILLSGSTKPSRRSARSSSSCALSSRPASFSFCARARSQAADPRVFSSPW